MDVHCTTRTDGPSRKNTSWRWFGSAPTYNGVSVTAMVTVTVTVNNTVTDTVNITDTVANTVTDTVANTVADTVTNTVTDTVTNAFIVTDTFTTTTTVTFNKIVPVPVTNTVPVPVTNTVPVTVTNTVTVTDGFTTTVTATACVTITVTATDAVFRFPDTVNVIPIPLYRYRYTVTMYHPSQVPFTFSNTVTVNNKVTPPKVSLKTVEIPQAFYGTAKLHDTSIITTAIASILTLQSYKVIFNHRHPARPVSALIQ